MDPRAFVEVRRPAARYRSRNRASGSAQSPIDLGRADAAGPEIIDLEAEGGSPEGGKTFLPGESSSRTISSSDEPLPKRPRSSRSDNAAVATAVNVVPRLRRNNEVVRRRRWRQHRHSLGARLSDVGGVVATEEQQIRDDERLARELQNAFASEASASGNDAELARSLQEEGRQELRHPADDGGFQPFQMMSYMRQQIQAMQSRNQRLADSRMLRRFLLEEHMNGIGGVLRRRIPLAMHLAYVDRDFNENDYDMLLALDEGVTKRGASQTKIDALPVTEAAEADKSEACSICLEHPVGGEQIRRLPCLHSFHQKCIDAWLQRRANCPVCKASV